MAKKTNQKKVKLTRADLVKMANKLKRNRVVKTEKITQKDFVKHLGKKLVVCKELPPELKTPEVLSEIVVRIGIDVFTREEIKQRIEESQKIGKEEKAKRRIYFKALSKFPKK